MLVVRMLFLSLLLYRGQSVVKLNKATQSKLCITENQFTTPPQNASPNALYIEGQIIQARPVSVVQNGEILGSIKKNRLQNGLILPYTSERILFSLCTISVISTCAGHT